MISRRDAVWVVDMADRAAARLCRQDRGSRLEQEDVRQDLLLDLLSRLGAYDPTRGSLETFASVCFRHRSARVRQAAHRANFFRHPIELDAPSIMGGGMRVTDTLSGDNGFRAWVGQPTDHQIELEQRLDLDRILAALPNDMSLLCVALVTDQPPPPTVAARSRSTRHRRVRNLRKRLAVHFVVWTRPDHAVAPTLSAPTALAELGK